ncbi:MAG: NUDIX domain-containing protein [Clostridia bacterium]|nr:NUDIX domain-containing protein [Clostridia bacterium]
MTDYILKDHDGNVFISMENRSEDDLESVSGLTHCLAVVKIDDDFLFGWNKWRNRWEIFGECIDSGESAGECIARECFEELGIKNGEFTYLGLMEFLMMPDWFSSEERIEYGGLYGITLNNITLDELRDSINDREEIAKLALYSDIRGKEPIAPIDEKLLEYYI